MKIGFIGVGRMGGPMARRLIEAGDQLTIYDTSEAAMQPVLLTVNDDNPNGANVRFLIDGAPVPGDAAAYQRIVLLFDGEDEEAVAAARARWGEAKAKGFEATYWQADENGRWQRNA